MILFTAKLIKILIALAAIAGAFFLFRRKLSPVCLAGVGVLTVVISLAANLVSGAVPSLRDQVVLTALGQKREESFAEEVYLTGYSVDGKFYSSGSDLKIRDGKWFWIGETYCWRIETDTRQPEGVTRSIEISIPVGFDREMVFEGNSWRGYVLITQNGSTELVDTYNTDGSSVVAKISRSTSGLLILNQIQKLAVYLVVSVLLLALLYRGIYCWTCRPKETLEWIRARSCKLICGAIALFTFLLMFHYAEAGSLWNDEILRVHFASGKLKDCIGYLLSLQDMSPPLFLIIAHFWLKICPFGEKWLLLISIVPVVLSVYIIGLCGESLYGRRCGIIASVLIAFSLSVWGSGAFEFSGYALMIFFTTLCLYTHIKKSQTNKNCYLVAFSISMVGLSMSHYFGMIACAEFFIFDIILLLQKKSRWKAIAAYVTPGAASLVWMGLLWKSSISGNGGFGQLSGWYGVPTFTNVLEMLNFSTGYFKVTFFLMLASIFVSLVLFIRKAGKRFEFWPRAYQQFSALSVAGTLLSLYGYGNFVNHALTLWQDRYFLFLAPHAALSISLTVCFICTFISKNSGAEIAGFRQSIAAVILGVLTFLNCFFSLSASGYGVSQPFREAAEWIYGQGNEIYNKDTLIVTTCDPEGWQDYYVTRCGRRDRLNIVPQWAVNEEMLNGYNIVYLQYSHFAISEDLQKLLDENFTIRDDIQSYNLSTFTRNVQ